MALSDAQIKKLMSAVTDQSTGNLVADGIDAGLLSTHVVTMVKIATNVSQTVDFAALAVGDIVVIIPAALGTSMFRTVATAGTLGQAAVVGSLYIALRAREADNVVKF
jgi:hypothetical protein